jgi:hypothetical protein
LEPHAEVSSYEVVHGEQHGHTEAESGRAPECQKGRAGSQA